MENGIDWKKLRERIQDGPFAPIVPPQQKKTLKTPEEIEAFREKERIRSKAYREANPDKCHAAEKRWRLEHPEECKAKRRLNYDKHKNDPEWKAKKCARQKRYCEAHKNDPAYIEKRKQQKREYRKRKRERNKLCYNGNASGCGSGENLQGIVLAS